MKIGFILIGAGIVLLGLGVWSLLAGKTLGLYGMIVTRSSPFYWIIVITYFLLGIFNIIAGVRMSIKWQDRFY